MTYEHSTWWCDCGGEMVPKQVEKLLRGGQHTAVLTVPADVCLRCGERLYSDPTLRRFEEVRVDLAEIVEVVGDAAPDEGCGIVLEQLQKRDDFLRVRDELDHERRFANPYLERVLGP